MKYVFLLGGFIGFALVGVTGFLAERRLGLVLRDAALGCLVGAVLFRWWWRIVVRAIDQTIATRRAEAEAEAARNPPPAHPIFAAANLRPAAPPASTPARAAAPAAPAPAAARSR